MALGDAMSRVTTPIFLLIVYYVVLTPLAVVRRLMRRNRRAASSHWHDRPPLPGAERMERQF
jgi:hypothetical protein